MERPPRILPVVLGAAILGIAVSGPLARLSQADALAIATWRVSIALVVIALMLTATGGWREYRTLARRDLAIALTAGVMLALHFWTWITSLAHTSVAASVVLVNLHPVVIVGGSALFLSERPSRRQVAGIVVAMIGAAVVAFGDTGRDPSIVDDIAGAFGEVADAVGLAQRQPLLGDLLAVIGAATVGVYYLVGRSLRQRLSLWPYVGLVYGACLVALLALAAGSGATLWPQPAREWWIFAAIAVGPMLLGHTGFNWSLKYVPAYVVSLALLAEPVGATILAAVIPGIAETPGPWTLVGGAIALTGLALGTVAEGRVGGVRSEVEGNSA
jgi:drug/metabolite transporter (DMT)-like permease